jgi:hypothetical protein
VPKLCRERAKTKAARKPAESEDGSRERPEPPPLPVAKRGHRHPGRKRLDNNRKALCGI